MYEKQNFTDGSILYAKQLNYIEDGIVTMTPIKGTDYWTASDKQEIINELNTNSVPDYVAIEADRVARIVNKHQSADSIVFPFLADAHCGYYTDTENEATRLAGQLLAEINKKVSFDFVVNGGDMTNGAWDTTREKTYEQCEDYSKLTYAGQNDIPCLWMPGNHDDAPYMATIDRLTQSEVFSLIGRKSRVNNAVCDKGCNYGYLDLDNRHLRIIYLDTDDKRNWGTVKVGAGETSPNYLNAHNISGQQLKWLVNIGLDFSNKIKPEEWSIIICSHVPLTINGNITDAVSSAVFQHNTSNVATVLKDYLKGNDNTITHNNTTIEYKFSQISQKAEIICAISGHEHRFSSDTLTGNIVSIGCPNIMNGRERVSDDGNTYSKIAGTAQGTSFCIITIDRINQKIYADCVGIGPNRVFSYSENEITYVNQLPLSTNVDGAIYNNKGYKENTYLSGGNEGTKAGIYTTGFIPCKLKDILYCKNIGMQTDQDAHRLAFFDASKQYLAIVKTSSTGYTGFVYGADNNINQIKINSTSGNSSTAYVRLCCGYLSDDSIITVNEEIK